MTTLQYLPPPPQREPILDRYLTYVSDDGLDLERFIEQGSHLLVPADFKSLRTGLPDLREKMRAFRGEVPRLARQVEFLADFFLALETRAPLRQADPARLEIAFALIYVARDMDLMPDDLPGVGLADDAAVVETVLTRHAGILRRGCRQRRLAWADLQPEQPRRS